MFVPNGADRKISKIKYCIDHYFRIYRTFCLVGQLNEPFINFDIDICTYKFKNEKAYYIKFDHITYSALITSTQKNSCSKYTRISSILSSKESI